MSDPLAPVAATPRFPEWKIYCKKGSCWVECVEPFAVRTFVLITNCKLQHCQTGIVWPTQIELICASTCCWVHQVIPRALLAGKHIHIHIGTSIDQQWCHAHHSRWGTVLQLPTWHSLWGTCPLLLPASQGMHSCAVYPDAWPTMMLLNGCS